MSTVRFVPELPLADIGTSENALLVCDHNTAPLLPAGASSPLVIRADEEHKSWSTVAKIIDAAHRAGCLLYTSDAADE